MHASREAHHRAPSDPGHDRHGRAAGQPRAHPSNRLHPREHHGPGAADGELAFDLLKGPVAGAIGVWAMDRVDSYRYERGLDTPDTRRRTEALRLCPILIEDEIANPLLGSAAPPGRYPWTAHARGLVAHLVYGLVTDAVLSLLNGGRPPRPARGRSS